MTDTLLDFPCEFPLKIVGRQNETFRASVDTALAGAGVDLIGIAERPSRSGSYVALTVTVVAESRAQLDELYTLLSALDDVKWAL